MPQAWDEDYHFRITIQETAGTGVTITGYELQFYNSNGRLVATFVEGEAQALGFFNECGGPVSDKAYIPGGLSRCVNMETTGGRSDQYEIWTFRGVDDLGNIVEGSGKLQRTSG